MYQTEFNLGIDCRNVGNWKKAIRHFSAAEKEAKQEQVESSILAMIHYELGNAFWNSSQNIEARLHFDEAIALDPQVERLFYMGKKHTTGLYNNKAGSSGMTLK